MTTGWVEEKIKMTFMVTVKESKHENRVPLAHCMNLDTEYSNIKNFGFIGPTEKEVDFRWDIREWMDRECKGKAQFHLHYYDKDGKSYYTTFASFELERDMVLFKVFWL